MIAGKICIWKLRLSLSTNMHFAPIILYETKIDRYVLFLLECWMYVVRIWK